MSRINESTYFILGMGNIGKILVKRLLDSGTNPENIMVYDADESRKASVVDQYGVKSADPADDQIRKADVIILATPPKAVVDVLKIMTDQLIPQQIIISMAAAVSLKRMREFVRRDVAVVRILPNPPSMLGKGMNPVAFEPGTISEVKSFIYSFLEVMGNTIEVHDDLMSWCVGLSGAALRTILPVLEGMTLAGVEAGLPPKDARRVAALNMAGVASLALETDLSFEQIRSLTPMQTLDEKMVSDLFLDTARNIHQKVEATQASLMG